MANNNNKRQNLTYTHRDFDKYAAQREQMQAEINGLAKGMHYHPKADVISFEKFAKTEADRDKVKSLKIQNKMYLKRAGLDPKKWMNDPNSNMGIAKRNA
jgi:hypothetical protein